MPSIIISKNSNFYHIFPVEKNTHIGRGPGNDVVLNQSGVSRKHARIDLTDKGYYLFDEGSKNGTFVDNRQIKRHLLTHGTSFQIQDFLLTFVDDFRVQDEAAARAFITATNGADAGDDLTSTQFIRPVASKRKNSEKFNRLLEMVTDLHAASADDDTGALVLKGVIEITGAKRGIIARLHATDGPTITHMHGFGPDGKLPEAIHTVLKNVLLDKPSLHSRHTEREGMRNVAFDSKAMLCVPLSKDSETIGCLYVDCPDTARGGFSDIDRDLLLSSAGYVSDVLVEERRLSPGLGRDLEQFARDLERRGIVARSPKTLKVFKDTQRIAQYNVAVLIYGETGTGKEVIARYIHDKSGRTGKFIACNCSAIAGALVESELFGHEKGAFTGATEQKPGLLELADQGTIFLDEIGDMPPDQQSKLLRALQEQEVWRVGGRAPVKINVRVISATHKDIKKNRDDLGFRDDLYYRIANVEITVPPLRDRNEDIAPLSHLILRDLNERHLNREKILSISPKTLRLLEAHDWPGNIRELRNTLFQVATRCDGDTIQRRHLKDLLDIFEVSPKSGSDPILPLEDIERQHIILAMEHAQWNKSAAAKILKMDRNRLTRHIKKLCIEEPDK